MMGGPFELYAPPRIPENKPKMNENLSVFNLKSLGLKRLNSENVIKVNARILLTNDSFALLRKVKPIGIPIIVEMMILFNPVISNDRRSCNIIQRAAIKEINAERGAAVFTLTTNVNKGIAISASPNPKVARRTVENKIMARTIRYSFGI